MAHWHSPHERWLPTEDAISESHGPQRQDKADRSSFDPKLGRCCRTIEAALLAILSGLKAVSTVQSRPTTGFR
jgi:hypothetical protein